MKNKLKLVGVPALLVLSGAANAAVVDLFSTDQAFLVDTTNAGVMSSQVGSGVDTTILGGYRDLVISATSGATNNQTASIGVENGTLYYNNASSVTSWAEIQWDGNDAGTVESVNYTGLSNADLTLNGATAFQLTTEFSDLDWVFELFIYTSSTQWTSVSLDANQVGGIGGLPAPHVSYIDFAAFTLPGLCGTYGAASGVNSITCVGGGADITNVGAIVARLNTGDPAKLPTAQPRTIAVDLQLTSVKTVPEPSVLGLLGIGLLGMGIAARRRVSAKA